VERVDLVDRYHRPFGHLVHVERGVVFRSIGVYRRRRRRADRHLRASPACNQILQATLIESWNGSVWSIVPSPNTSDNQPNYLTAVSCSGSTACTAVGIDAVDGLENQTLMESWNGSVWSIIPSPNTSSIQNKP
jgi:hypothetical protein